MSYLHAVLKNDEDSKRELLEKLIDLGKDLGKDTSNYEDELSKLKPKEPPISTTSSLIAQLYGITPKKNDTKDKIEEDKEETKSRRVNSSKKKDSEYSIKSVTTTYNSIVVEYDREVDEKDLNFFELHYKTVNKDVFDFKGRFKDAKPTKLSINGVDKISIAQFKADTLRVVLSDKKDLKTIYKFNGNKIEIIILDIKAQKTPIKNVKKVSPGYDIESVETIDNSIVINFIRKVSNKDLKYFEQNYKSLHRDVFNIKGRFEDARPTKLSIDGVDKITISQHKYDTLRIILSDNKNLKTKYAFKGKSIVISILNLPKSTTSNKASKITPTLPIERVKMKNYDRVIVIDPGHGGKDAGAVGPGKKRYEKYAVFKVSKYLYDTLKKRGYKVYLTRTKDRYIKVKKRTVLANKKNADIFISIHANAVPKSKAHKIKGIETFFLSPARSDRAKRVAALENSNDIEAMNYASKSTFLTVLNQSKITQSNKLAIDVQQNLLYNVRRKFKGVEDGGVREGPFWVLVGAQMPSILIELGYISHPLESKRLFNTRYQKELAKGIANGIDTYFSKNQ